MYQYTNEVLTVSFHMLGAEGFSEAYFSGQSYLQYTADAVSIDL